MGSWRDMRPANWARTVARLRRAAAELREHGFEVIEPVGLEKLPEQRIAHTSTTQ